VEDRDIAFPRELATRAPPGTRHHGLGVEVVEARPRRIRPVVDPPLRKHGMKGSTHSFSIAVEPRFQVGAGHVPNGILVRSWSFHGPILRAPSTTCRTLEGGRNRRSQA